MSQAFINQSFENITSIEHSLKLLHKFQSILQRESLKSDLDSKLNIIFQVGTSRRHTVSHHPHVFARNVEGQCQDQAVQQCRR